MPTKENPRFFIYSEQGTSLNTKTLNSLTVEDVAHLSPSERDFVSWYKAETKDGVWMNIFSSADPDERLSQEEECAYILRQPVLTRDLDTLEEAA